MKTLILLLTLLATTSVSAQWQPTTGPEGGYITNLTSVNGKLIAEVRSGSLYRLDGQRWTKLTSEIAAYEYYSLGAHLLHTKWDGVYLSTDEGSTWAKVLDMNAAPRIAIDHDTLIASHANAIYRSNDRGRNWSEVVHQPVLGDVALMNGIMIGAPMNETGAVRSTDGGTTFTRSIQGMPDTVRLGRVTRDHGFFYAGTNAGIFVSADGASWSKFEQGLSSGMPVGFKRLQHSGDFVFLHTLDTVYVATLNGWKMLSPRPLDGLVEHESVIYAPINGRIMTSFFMGDDWTKTTPDLLANTIRHITAAGQYMMASGAAGIFRTDNDGESWQRVSEMRAEKLISQGSTVFAYGTNENGQRELIKSMDQGGRWQKLKFPEDSVYNLSAITRNVGYLYVGISDHDIFNPGIWHAGGVLRSTDRGTTWARASNGLPSRDGIAAPVIGMYADDELQLASTVEGLYRSTDGGDNWIRTNYGDDVELPSNPIYFQRVGTAHYAASTEAIYRTTDLGGNWTRMPGQFELIMNLGRFEDSLAVIASDSSKFEMLRLREVGGVTEWVNISDRLPEGVEPLTVLEGGLRVYLGTIENGVWVLRRSPASVDAEQESTGRLYPNPASETVTIELGERMEGSAKITITDALGRIALESNVAIDNDKITIDVQTLPAGSYEYSIETTKKIIRGKLLIRR